MARIRARAPHALTTYNGGCAWRGLVEVTVLVVVVVVVVVGLGSTAGMGWTKAPCV